MPIKKYTETLTHTHTHIDDCCIIVQFYCPNLLIWLHVGINTPCRNKYATNYEMRIWIVMDLYVIGLKRQKLVHFVPLSFSIVGPNNKHCKTTDTILVVGFVRIFFSQKNYIPRILFKDPSLLGDYITKLIWFHERDKAINVIAFDP